MAVGSVVMAVSAVYSDRYRNRKIIIMHEKTLDMYLRGNYICLESVGE
jgi:hypothetical protein